MSKRFKPTDDQRKQVEAMAGYGMTIPQIADVLDKAEATIKRHFKPELRVGKLKANAKVAEALYMVATKGKGSAQVTAAMFWLKTQARWTTVENLNIQGLPQFDHLADLRNLSRTQLLALDEIARHLGETTEHGPVEPHPNRVEGQSNGLPSHN